MDISSVYVDDPVRGLDEANRKLDEAETELIGLYSEKLARSYAKGDLGSCDETADRLLRYLPGDIFARFVKGAVAGRRSIPSEMHVDEAFRWWKPLVAELDDGRHDDDRDALLQAIAPAFHTMTDTPVDLSIRAWYALHDLESIERVAGVLQEYLALPGKLIDDERHEGWIGDLFDANWASWTARAIQPNTPIPSGDERIQRAFGDMARAAVGCADRIPEPMDESAAKVRRRANEVLARYKRMTERAR